MILRTDPYILADVRPLEKYLEKVAPKLGYSDSQALLEAKGKSWVNKVCVFMYVVVVRVLEV